MYYYRLKLRNLVVDYSFLTCPQIFFWGVVKSLIRSNTYRLKEAVARVNGIGFLRSSKRGWVPSVNPWDPFDENHFIHGAHEIYEYRASLFCWVLIYTSITQNLTITLGISKLTLRFGEFKNNVNTRVSEWALTYISQVHVWLFHTWRQKSEWQPQKKEKLIMEVHQKWSF